MSPRHGFALAAFALGLGLASTRARAQVRQPDGTQIPVAGDGTPLAEFLRRRMEVGLDVTRDAATTPERFRPGCSIRFTVVGRDSGYENRFGWYNVVAGRAPAMSELYELVGPSLPEGASASVDFLSDTRYRGGEIGFYLLTPPGHVYYSERAYQPDRDVTNGFIHLLIYDSRATPNAFYFAWEDLFGGGDNDFQDLLMIVDNLVCAGGGDRCDTGMPGACAQGIRQCRNGMLACLPVTQPRPERCNGQDDDCDGMVDEGDGLCGAMEVCDRGRCVERCQGELGCLAPDVCTDRGTCVDPACATLECPAGQVCVGGRCRAPCEGVTCPAGLACRADRCVDPCLDVTCDPNQVCVDGVCQFRCPCRPCGAGETCFTDGRCRAAACASVTCPTGSVCVAGACRDACEGAVCPGGARCERGGCAEPARDAGVARPDVVLSDVVVARDAQVADAAMDVPRDVAPQEQPSLIEDGTASGCGCRATSSPPRGAAAALGAALLALAQRRRARRTRSPLGAARRV
ncbi:MAG: DUF4114 domain-containing protein [Polyangiales bacterium]